MREVSVHGLIGDRRAIAGQIGMGGIEGEKVRGDRPGIRMFIPFSPHPARAPEYLRSLETSKK